MCWFRNRSRRSVGFDEAPESIVIEDTFFEAVIDKFFAEATEKAKDLEPGDRFEVTIDTTSIPEGVHPMVLVGPIMMRAMSHGFMPGASVNWTFYLSKM